jgi:purine-cytosine permease-like protein
MDLPVTHFLYASCALILVGLWVALASDHLEHRALARNAGLGGVALAATAFARYWSLNSGQGLALLVLVLLVLSSLVDRVTNSAHPASGGGGEDP